MFIIVSSYGEHKIYLNRNKFARCEHISAFPVAVTYGATRLSFTPSNFDINSYGGHKIYLNRNKYARCEHISAFLVAITYGPTRLSFNTIKLGYKFLWRA